MFRTPVAIATTLLLIAIPLRPEDGLAQHGHGGIGHASMGHGDGHPGGVSGSHGGHLGATGFHEGFRSRADPFHQNPFHDGFFRVDPGHGGFRRRVVAPFGIHGDPFFGGHGLRVGVVLGTFPYFGPWNGYRYPYYGYGYGSSAPYIRDDVMPRVGDRIAVPGSSGAGDSLVVDQASESIVRLTWEGGGRQVEEVGLFLADEARTVIALQTLRGPPFRALFEPPPGVALAGATVVWRSGKTSTTLVAYRLSR